MQDAREPAGKPKQFNHVIFDRNGNTYPHEPLNMKLEFMKYFLVQQFPESTSRPYGWDQIHMLKDLLTRFLHMSRFEIWIHGTYTRNLQDPPYIEITICIDQEELDHLLKEEMDFLNCFLVSDAFAPSKACDVRKVLEKGIFTLP